LGQSGIAAAEEYNPDDAKNAERVYMHTKDILGKTDSPVRDDADGEIESVKKLIEATEELSNKSATVNGSRPPGNTTANPTPTFEDNLTAFYPRDPETARRPDHLSTFQRRICQ